MVLITQAFMDNLLGRVHTLPYMDNLLISSIAIVLAFAVFAGILLFLFNGYLKTLAGKTETIIDDLIFKYTSKPIFLLILVFGIKLALFNIGWHDRLVNVVDTLLAATFLFVLMRILDVFIEGWGLTFSKRTESKLDDVLLPLFHKASHIVFVIIALMWALNIWGINITPYLAGVGISGIVLGLALQDSLKNVLGGINLLVDKTYQIGDKIKLESGEVGIIHDIGLRSTKLMTFNNEVVYIPNGYLANSRVMNFTQPDTKVRGRVDFSVEYGTDVEKVRKVVLGVVGKIDGVSKKQAPSVQFFEMGDFALKFRVFFWVEHWDKEAAMQLKITEEIYNALNKAKIKIPYPTQVVHVKD